MTETIRAVAERLGVAHVLDLVEEADTSDLSVPDFERFASKAQDLAAALQDDARFLPEEREAISLLALALTGLVALVIQRDEQSQYLRNELARVRPWRGVFTWGPEGT